MASALSFTKTGAKATTKATLPKEVFDVIPKNHTLIYELYRSYEANARKSSGHTLTRGLVSGGGRKPWRQKGTGRARAGSIRGPIWRGGGVVFGPSGDENFKLKVSKKAKLTGLRQALSLKAQADQIVVIEDFDIKEAKTKEAQKLLSKLPAAKNILLVVENKTEKATKALRNLPNVEFTTANYLNIFKIMNADSIILTKGSLDVIKGWLAPKKAVAVAEKPAAKEAKK